MRYTLINCYSDNNKGDLGIILATIDLLKEHDSSADIVGISTYNYSDPNYHHEHSILSQSIQVLPSIFGELNIVQYKSIPAKIVRFAFDLVRLLIFCSIPIKIKRLRKFLFSKAELDAIRRIEISDYVISKGGSFLCNENNVRSKLGLFRFLFIFFLCFKLRKRVIIFCQSLGPVYGKISRKIINHLLSKCYKIILREKLCIEQYNYLLIEKTKLIISNDIAFFLNTEKTHLIDLNIDESKFNVGMTIKSVDKSKLKRYFDMIVDSMIFLIENYSATIHIFPHVTTDNADREVSFQIYNAIDDKYKSQIRIYTGNYSARELKKLYSLMDIFIGTRLHSAIFAMGELVPSICISYHGTKALGIYRNFGLEEYVVIDYSSQSLISKINNLVYRKSELKNTLRAMIDRQKLEFIDSVKKLF